MAVSGKSPNWFATRRGKNFLFQLFIYVLLIGGGWTFILPFLWMVSTSLKVDTQIFLFPPKWIPSPIKWVNYLTTLIDVPFLLWLRNTCYVTALNIVGTLFSCSLVAYSFARLEWKGRDICFVVLLSTMMLPPQVTMVPLYLVFKYLGWVNSFKPLYIRSFFGLPFYIFLLRQFFKTIPREMEEAAMIDGCSPYGIYWRIMLPLVKPALATVTIFRFRLSWNDFITPLIYINSPNRMTLSLGLQYFNDQYTTDWALLMSAATMMTIPMILIFFFAQKYFVRGVVLTGLKG